MDVDGWTTYDRLVFCELDALTNAQRALVAIGVLRSEVGGGGFHRYFSNDGGDLAPAAREAAVSAGLTPLVDLLDRAMAVFGPTYPVSRVDRQAALLSLADDHVGAFDAEWRDLEMALDLDHVMDRLAAGMQRAATLIAQAAERTDADTA